MRLRRQKTIPAQEVIETYAVTCDICGRQSDAHGDPDSWTHDPHRIVETEVRVTRVATTIKSSEGTSYPEGGSRKEWTVDICPACFKGKLVPWLVSQGAKIREQEFDW